MEYIEGLAKPWGEPALYFSYAQKMVEGLLPYKDFFPEYPPLAMFFLKLPLILFDSKYYTLAYYGLVGLFLLLTVLLIHKMRGNAFAFVASVLSLGGLFWDRFDIFPAFFTVLAIYFTEKKRFNLAFFVLSLGFLTKLYPILLLPLIAFYLLKDLKKLTIGLVVFVLPILLVVGYVISYGGQDGLLKFVEFQGKRGLHLESVRATPLLIQKLNGKVELETKYEHNTFEVIKK